jgi:hypothetical protein
VWDGGWKIFPVLFTQGINEMQQAARLMGTFDMQRDINLCNMTLLRAYYDLFKAHRLRYAAVWKHGVTLPVSDTITPSAHKPIKRASHGTFLQSSMLVSSMGQVMGTHFEEEDEEDDMEDDEMAEDEVARRTSFAPESVADISVTTGSETPMEHLDPHSRISLSTIEGLLEECAALADKSSKDKDGMLLQRTSYCIRSMGGARVTSCKSAKDRTSMSVTLEQGLILSDRHGLSELARVEAVRVFRVHGIRLENVLKNIGKRKFCFNALQNAMLPAPYMCPEGTGGGGTS